MSLLNFFTQGGQTQLHQLRMIRQVMVATITAALFIGLMAFVWKVFSFNTQRDLYHIYSYYWAHLQLEMPFVQKKLVMQNFTTTDRNGSEHIKSVRSLDVMGDRGILWSVRKFEYSVKEGLRLGIINALVSLLLMSVLWIWRGRKNKQKKLLSGVKVIQSADLKKLIKKLKQASHFVLGKVPLIKGEETKHFLLSGTTGSGKTNCLHELLPQIRASGQRAIIVDLTGEFVSKYYQSQSDTILNPFDQRTKGWNPWAECRYPYHYEDMVANLVPSSQTHDPFWTTSARMVLSEAFKKEGLEENRQIKNIHGFLSKMSITDLEKFFAGSDVAGLINKDGEKTASSIRATLMAAIRSLKYLEGFPLDFSVREWVESKENGWLFLTSTPDQREALRPLLSSWVSIAISALLSLVPEEQRRLWFIMDEVAALQKLPSLPTALAESRKYGGCFVLGVQDVHQLERIYGVQETKTILGLLNTKLIFRSPDSHSAKRFSDLLGEQESSEIIEGLSFGAHHMRDGVSLNDQRRIRPAVSSTELMNLKNLEAYLKLPEGLPIAKIKFTYQPRPKNTEGFVLRRDFSASIDG